MLSPAGGELQELKVRTFLEEDCLKLNGRPSSSANMERATLWLIKLRPLAVVRDHWLCLNHKLGAME